jgi:thymidine kinase
MTNSRLPEGILERSKKEKIEYFEGIKVNHKNLKTAYNETMTLLDNSALGKVYLIYGPSGVGKTTLCERIRQKILTDNEEEINSNPGFIPITYLEIPSYDSGASRGTFNWKDFYRRLLDSVQEPLIDNKIHTPHLLYQIPKKKILTSNPIATPELRESIEKAFSHRGVKIVLLDEAQHFIKWSSDHKLYEQMDTIKSIANITGTIFVLFGTFQLRDMLNINGQLTRRSDDVYFKRYDITIPEDQQNFKDAVKLFQEQLPFNKELELESHWEFLYERSIGCIGILKDWLDFCVRLAINRDHNALSIKVVENYAPSRKKALVMAQEAIKYENDIREENVKRGQLQELLGLKKSKNSNSVDLTDDKKGKKTPKKDVGKRAPTRDQIGIDKYEN